MDDDGLRCPGCGSEDTAVRGIPPDPRRPWSVDAERTIACECRRCGVLFAHRIS